MSGVTIVQISETDVTIVQGVENAGPPGPAVIDASYVTLGTNTTLTSERVLTEGTGIDITDAGAGSTVTVAVDLTELSAGGDLTGTYDAPGIASGVITNDEINASAAIALSKLAAISTARILGRTTSGSGAIEELSQASVFGFLGTGTPSGTTYLRGDGTWSTPAGGGSVATDAIFDAKGDLAVGTGADTASRLAVGTNGRSLVADSTASTGVSWAVRPNHGAPLSANLAGAGLPGITLPWGSTASNTVQGYVYMVPFVIVEHCSFDAYYARVDSGVASTVLDCAIYSCPDWKTGSTLTLVTNTNTSGTDCSASGLKTITLGSGAVVLPPGRYVLAYLARGGAGNINFWYGAMPVGYLGFTVSGGSGAPLTAWVQTTGASGLSGTTYTLASVANSTFVPVTMRRG